MIQLVAYPVLDPAEIHDQDHLQAVEQAVKEDHRKTIQARLDNDPFVARLDAAINKVESYLRPKIRLGHE